MTMADLTVIPDVYDRLRADTDFRIAKQSRQNAARKLRMRTPGWRTMHRLEMARAIRFWRHYARAVRSAGQ